MQGGRPLLYDMQPASLDLSQSAENSEQMKSKELMLDYGSKSSSEMDGAASADDLDTAATMKQRRSKKRYHRHTHNQILEMERLFKECPHPDEKRRQQLSKDLGLEPKQVKFWFQNKRTQMKTQHERMDNASLRAENEKLKAEVNAAKEARGGGSDTCPFCGNAANLTGISFDEQQLRSDNAKLRDEIKRLSTIASKYTGKPVSSITTLGTIPPPSPGVLRSTTGGADDRVVPGPSVVEIASRPLGLTEAEKPILLDLAVSAMDELIFLAHAGEPYWVATHGDDQPPSLSFINDGSSPEVLDTNHYSQRFPKPPTTNIPFPLTTETSRDVGLVIINANSLVETMMETNQWMDTFAHIISSTQLVEILCAGAPGSYDGAMHLMYAEFHAPTPLIQSREAYFLRYSKYVNENMWVVVDVAIDSLRGNPPPSLLRCRRRPSGCVIQEMPNGYTKVSWVEHVEVENRGLNPLYYSFVKSGMAFGARRWLAILQRKCERMASLLAKNISPRELGVIPSQEGRRNMLKLAERMTNNFCSEVSASKNHTWIGLSDDDDHHVVIRKSINDPGKPHGIVLSAATSLKLPVPPSKLFHFLRDQQFRTEWDILSNNCEVEEMVYVANGHDPGNCVSLLRVNTLNSSQSNNMLILQECCTDESCSLVVYAPVDISSIGNILNGGNPDEVALLPSGFAIHPDGEQHHQHLALLNLSIVDGLDSQSSPSIPSSIGNCSSILTVAFQILVDHIPTAKLSLASVNTVKNLISSTVTRIKNAMASNVGGA